MSNELRKKTLIEGLKYACNKVIENTKAIDELVRENNLQNEQFFIDWQDELNEISVR